MFEVKDLHVRIGSREIIRGIFLELKAGSIHVIMGPNGAGKSSLALALMGHPDFRTTGKIILDKTDLSRSGADVRAKKGMFLSFQNPEEIEGIKVWNLINKARESREGSGPDLDRMVEYRKTLIWDSKMLGLPESFIQRDINVGFSGGEKKRTEILQMLALKPRVIILDEVDSGLDVDGVRLVADSIRKMQDGSRCFLIITHYPRLLKYITPDKVHILENGIITRSGGPELAHEIEEKGYLQNQPKKQSTGDSKRPE